MTSYTMGINCAYHESAVCLLRDGQIVDFIEEERLNRIRHAKPSTVHNADTLPVNSINYCLNEAGINFSDIDYFAYNLVPLARLNECVGVDTNHQIIPASWGTQSGEESFYQSNLRVIN